jgi:hypothetical protein
VLLACTGPGLVVVPGLGLVGVAGTVADIGVWKYSGVVKDDSPAVLPAATFQRYVPPAANVAVKLVVVG